jgi:hypothetical protein
MGGATDPSSRSSQHAYIGNSRVEVTLTREQLDHLATVVAERLDERRDPETGWLRGAEKIARYIDAPLSRVYALASAGRIPCERDGSSLIAHRGDLDAWLRAGGGRRP